jgi:WD40 repeat protein
VATLEGHENEVKGVAWSPCGGLVATCGRDKSVWVWEALPGNEFECVDVKHGHAQARAAAVVASLPRPSLAPPGRVPPRVAGRERTALRRCSSRPKKTPKQPPQNKKQDVKAVAWHPSGELLASCSYDDAIKLWASDGDEWACVATVAGSAGAAAGAAGAAASGAAAGHGATVWSVAWDAAGGRLASCSDDLSVRVWRCERGGGDGGPPALAPLAVIAGHSDRSIFAVDWSPDGLLATADGGNAIRVFAESGGGGDGGDGSGGWAQVAAAERAHAADANAVRWHPRGGGLLASAGDDNCVRIWRLRAAAAAEGAPMEV